MIEVAVILAGYLLYRGANAELVVDAGDDMPNWLADSLQGAGFLPYRIPIYKILTSLITQDKKNQMPKWLDIYVDK